MAEFAPIRGKDIDVEQFEQFVNNIKYVLLQGFKQRYIGKLVGVEEGNWSKYWRGVNPINQSIIDEFNTTFKNVLKGKEGFLPQVGTEIVAQESPQIYLKENQSSTDLAEELKKMNAVQIRMEKKIDTLLTTNPKTS
jgi:hypothetical protein